jgi:type I restriction enzyme S subunit
LTVPAVPLRRLAQCLDGRRVPLDRAERATMSGDVPYWGSGGVLDTVGEALFDEPLVLLGEDGAPFFEVGRNVAFLLDGPAWVNNHIHVLRPNPGVDRRFLVHALNAVDYAAYITGSTRDKVTQDDMWQIRIPHQTYDRQLVIADYLDVETSRLDALIDAKRRMTELIREGLQSLLDQLIDPNHRVDGTYELPIRRVLRKLERPPGSVAVVTAFRDGMVLLRSRRREEGFTESENQAGYQGVYRGDVVFHGLDGFAGAIGVSQDDGVCTPVYHVCEVRKGFDASYVALVLRALALSGYLTLQSGNVRERAVDFRNWGSLARIRIPVPPEHLQRAIAHRYERRRAWTDSLVDTIERQTERLQEHRHALVVAAVAGQPDIPEAA